jgi:agmatinase
MSHLQSDVEQLAPGTVAVLGVPFDAKSSFRRGAALAPSRIREALHSDAANLCAEDGMDLGQETGWREIGDLVLPEGAAALTQIEQTVAALLSREARVVTLGGDHSITYPIVQAYARTYPRLNLLQFDAHPDLYDDLAGDRYSHACPFARIMEAGLVQRLVQLGVRTLTPHQRAQAARFGVEVIEMRHWHAGVTFDFDGPLYLSLDMDCLDPAFAPGVSHHEPGGLSTRQVLGVIQGLSGPLVGADIVELNPERDWMGMTAMVAAKFLKEILAQMLA